MSWNRAVLGFAYDPCFFSGGASQVFNFEPTARGRATPTFRLMPDEFAETMAQLADGSFRIYRSGAKPLRNIELGISQFDQNQAMGYRLFREVAWPFAVFPNYGADTCILTHFESNLNSELGVTPVYQDVSGVTQTAGYGSGVIGYGLTFDYCAARPRRLKYDTTMTSAAFTISSWWKVPGDYTSGMVLSLFSATASTLGSIFQVVMNANALQFDWSGGSSISADVGSIAAGSWHHFAASASGSTATIYFDGSAIATTGAYSPPTMAKPFYLGIAIHASYVGSPCRASSFDDFRWDTAALTATQIGALYDRGNELDELGLAKQTQGHYFLSVRDPFDPLALCAADLYSGSMLLQGIWSDPNQRVYGASYR